MLDSGLLDMNGRIGSWLVLIRTVLIVFGLALISAPGALGQTSVATSASAPETPNAATLLPSFEVATIKPTSPADRGESKWSPPGIGRFFASSVSLAFLIQMAYRVDDSQIAGKPDWLESELFDVVAKPEGDITLTRDELRPRLQTLLQQRFQLVAHRETKMIRGYALVVAKGGPKLKATNGDHPPGYRVYVGGGRLEGLNWSMQTLAAMLQPPTGFPVIDETGIKGGYNIKLDFSPELETDSSLPSLFTALQDTMGLKLESRKVPVEVLVIDHVNRFPTEN
jgi:uncharacterized protein (TIGR03435 family)